MASVDVRQPAALGERLRLDRPRPTRRRGVVTGAMCLVLGCAALAGIVALRADQRIELLAVARRVPAGQQIDATALRVVRANGGGLPVVPATARNRVIGRYAAVDLIAGTFLNPDVLADSGTPAPGEAIVAIALRPEQLPAGGVAPGDVLRLVATGSSVDGKPDQELVLAAAARVFTVARRTTAGQEAVSVSVVVSEAELPSVARAAAAGHVAVGLLNRGAASAGKQP